MKGQSMKMTMTQALRAGIVAAAMCAGTGPASAQPNPVLRLTGVENYTANGKEWVRHRYNVVNKAQYPAAMFAPAPNLPPCGLNTNSSRSWVDFFDHSGKRLYGFCALGAPKNLDTLWFATEKGAVAPAHVYIVIHDRRTNKKYKSNMAVTAP
jgi:endonuclease I